MKICVAGEYLFAWYEESCAQALEMLGHEVHRFMWHGHLSGLSGRIQKKFIIGPGIEKVNEALKDIVLREKPDILLVWRGIPIRPGTVQSLREKTDCLLTAYNNDSAFGAARRDLRWRMYRSSIPYFHKHFVYRPGDLAHVRRNGARSADILLPYYIPWVHYPIALSETDEARYGCDLAFIGHYEKDGRVEQLCALVEAGFHVRVYGFETWKRRGAARLRRILGDIRPVTGLDYAKAICASKASLCFLSRLNNDQYTRRCFEIPACGGVLLSERTPELQRFYEEDVEAVFFSNQDELLTKAAWLLGAPSERRRIAQAGRRRCVSGDHDVVSRMKEFLAKCEETTQE